MRYYFGRGFHMLSVIRPQKVKFLSDGGRWNKILSNGGLFLCQFRGVQTVHRDTTWLNVHLRSSVKVRVNTEELPPAYFLQECSTTHSIHYFWLLSLPIKPLCPVDCFMTLPELLLSQFWCPLQPGLPSARTHPLFHPCWCPAWRTDRRTFWSHLQHTGSP